MIIDPLQHLPKAAVASVLRNDPVYTAPNDSLHLVMSGLVKVVRVLASGNQCVVDIYRLDDLFGETSLLHEHRPQNEMAIAFSDAEVMSWPAADIESLVERDSALGMALMQLAVQREFEFAARIEILTQDNIERRLAKSILRFGERIGTRVDDHVNVPALTHELLSQYVGTSREVVTLCMNQFRRRGYLRYSRKGIQVSVALTEWLADQPGKLAA